MSCNIICVRDYMPWLQSVLSIHCCKGAAASVNQEGLKTSVNKHINLIVFIYLISWHRVGDFIGIDLSFWGTCAQGVNLSTWIRELLPKQQKQRRKRKSMDVRCFTLNLNYTFNVVRTFMCTEKTHCLFFYVPMIHNSLLNTISIHFLKSRTISTGAWSVLILDLHALLFYKLVLHVL